MVEGEGKAQAEEAVEPGSVAAPAFFSLRRMSTFRSFAIEIALLVQIVFFHALLAWRGVDFGMAMVLESLTTTAPTIVAVILGGMVVRIAVLVVVGRGSEVRAWISDRSWWIHSARYAVIGGLLSHLYTWLKVFVPVLHHRLFDAQLYALGRIVMLGHQPEVFLLNLFSNPMAMRAIDLGYSEAFMATLAFSVAFFLSSRDEPKRASFVAGFVALWCASLWLYAALPALGPCYAFASEFVPFRAQLPGSSTLQAMLFQNYQQVIRFALGKGEPLINPLFGVAAFPSLHVGHVAFVGLLMGRVTRHARLPFALLVAFMFVGSIVTGWHYMIDSLAGLLLAWLAFRAGRALTGQASGSQVSATSAER